VIASAVGTALSAALFQDLLIFVAFAIILGTIVVEAVWIELISKRPGRWFKISDNADPKAIARKEIFEHSEVLYTDRPSAFDFFLIRRVISGSLSVHSDLEFLKLEPERMPDRQSIAKVKATFRTPFSGEYWSKKLVLQAMSPLGLFSKRFGLPVTLEFKVFPRTIEVALESARLFAKAGIGETPTNKPGVGTEFYELREYTSLDDFRQINWKASARIGELIVNERMKELGGAYYLVLDARAESYYDKDRLAATFLQIANALVALNTRFGVLVHDGARIKTFSRIDSAQNSLPVAFRAALEFVDLPLSSDRKLYALNQMREELAAVPVYKLRSNQRLLSSKGLMLLAKIEEAAHANLEQSVRRESEPYSAILDLVKTPQLRGESEPPSILCITSMKEMSKIVELGSEIKGIYNSEFFILDPTMPWVIAPDDHAAYDVYALRMKNLRVLANAGIECRVGDAVAITKNLFG
jgi:Protein of unknown function DUF58